MFETQTENDIWQPLRQCKVAPVYDIQILLIFAMISHTNRKHNFKLQIKLFKQILIKFYFGTEGVLLMIEL